MKKNATTQKAGFSAMELMMVTGIAVVVMAAGMTGLRASSEGQVQERETLTIASQLRAARMLAVSSGEEVLVDIIPGYPSNEPVPSEKPAPVYPTDSDEYLLRKQVLFDGADPNETPSETQKTTISSSENSLYLKSTIQTGSFTPQGTFKGDGSPLIISVSRDGSATKYIYIFPSGHIQKLDKMVL